MKEINARLLEVSHKAVSSLRFASKLQRQRQQRLFGVSPL